MAQSRATLGPVLSLSSWEQSHWHTLSMAQSRDTLGPVLSPSSWEQSHWHILSVAHSRVTLGPVLSPSSWELSHWHITLHGTWLCYINSCPMGAAAYQLGNTSSRTITEVKQR